MGCNCGGAKNKPSPNPNFLANKGETIMNQQDTEYVEVLYNHRNKGGHPVYGGVTGTFYGYRAGGERFLVHQDDAKGQPTLFQVIPAQPTAPKITYQTPKQSPPPPTPIVDLQYELDNAEIVTDPVDETDYEDVLSGGLENIKRPLDLQTIVFENDDESKDRLAQAFRERKGTVEWSADSIEELVEKMEAMAEIEDKVDKESILLGDLDNVKRPLDLQTLPGVTAEIAKRMAAAGLDTEEAILEASVKGLTKIKGIAETRAKTIIVYLKTGK